jgi:hypothetical protein
LRKLILSLLLILPASAVAQADCNGFPIVTFSGWSGEMAALRHGFCVQDETGALYWQDGLPDWNSHNQMPVYFQTRAIWQSRGVIEQTAALNGVDLTPFDGAVALNSCALVGSTVYVRQNATERWIEVVVADCVKRDHLHYHTVAVESGIELQWELAEALGVTTHINEWGGVGMYGFEVCLGLPMVDCIGTPVDYTDWYLEHVMYE